MPHHRYPSTTGWPGPPGPMPGYYPQPDPANAAADLRERLARLETGQHHTSDWLRHVAGQVEAQDDRLRRLSSRLGQTADTVTGHTATLAKLDGLPSSLERAEAERKWRLDLLRYTAAGAIVIAVTLVKGDLSAVAGILSVLLGKPPVP